MTLLVITIASVIAMYLLLVYLGSQKVVASGIVTAGNGKFETKILYEKSNKKPLLAMALLYAAKINWLILSEPSMTKEIFTNIFENTLNEWPKVPNVDMRSATNSDVSVYKVKIYHIKNWSIDNVIPKKSYSMDLATNYFVLLNSIVNELNDEERAILREMLEKHKDDILDMSRQDSSVSVLMATQKKISETLNNMG